MKSLSKLCLLILLAAVVVHCSSPSDSNNDELSPGEFNSQATGVFEDKFSGNATFTMETVGLDENKFLKLDLEAGKIPFISDDLSNTYGIFLYVPWNSNGTLRIEDSDNYSLYVSPNSFFPYYPFILSSGIITIESHSADQITGEINISDTFSAPDSGSIEITGTFKAIRSE
jgi:hypothetical protein